MFQTLTLLLKTVREVVAGPFPPPPLLIFLLLIGFLLSAVAAPVLLEAGSSVGLELLLQPVERLESLLDLPFQHGGRLEPSYHPFDDWYVAPAVSFPGLMP